MVGTGKKPAPLGALENTLRLFFNLKYFIKLLYYNCPNFRALDNPNVGNIPTRTSELPPYRLVFEIWILITD